MAMRQGELVPQIFNHPEFGEVRIVDNNGEPWFVGKDVAEKLGYKNPNEAIADHVEAEDKLNSKTLSSLNLDLGQRGGWLINEGGLYSLTIRSNMPNAKKFTRWLTHEVVPSIRKHGVYMTAEAAEKIITNPDFIIGLAQQVKEARAERDAALAQVAELKPKADYCELILQSEEALPVTVIAKDYGMNATDFNKLLHKLKIQYKVGKTWVLYQIYAKLGYMKSVTRNLSESLSVTHNYWTQKGRMFLYSILKKANVLPLIERNAPMATLI